MKIKNVLYGVATVAAVAVLMALTPETDQVKTVDQITIKNEKTKHFAVRKSDVYRPGTQGKNNT